MAPRDTAGKKIRSTFKASLAPFHLRKASLWCWGAEMHYLSRSCSHWLPKGTIVKNVTGRSVHNDEVLMRFIWICEAVKEFDNCDCLPSRPLMNFHTSDSLVCLLFSDSVALLFHTIPSELCVTLSFFLALSFSLPLSLKGLVWIF